MKRGVHQVLGGAAPWDAITNHALAARDVMRGMGLRSELFADSDHISAAVAEEVLPHDSFPLVSQRGDVALLHYSIASPAFDMAVSHADRAAVVYHNVTPPELLWRDAPAIALQCQAGLDGLRALAPHVHASAAVSAFNARELTAAGFHEPAIIGILRGSLPHVTRKRSHNLPLRMLFVGRGIPNKRQDALVLALAAVRERGTEAELRLVGGWGACRPFRERCEQLADELGVSTHVEFVGSIDDRALAQEYADADVFVCLSQHEGYCVPLIEAMAHALPIVALRAGAVPETLGGAGVLIDDLYPSTVAEAVALATDPARGDDVAAARAAQLEHHSHEATAARLRAFVNDISVYPC